MPRAGNGFLGAYCDSFDGDIILKYANNEGAHDCLWLRMWGWESVVCHNYQINFR